MNTRPLRQRDLLVLVLFLLLLGFPGVAAADVSEAPVLGAQAIASQTPWYRPELRVAIFGGSVVFAGTNVSATYGCLFCTPVSASKNVRFDDSNVGGLRVEVWGGGEYSFIGFAMELNDINASSSEVDVNYTTYSLMPVFRYSFIKTPSMPGGHLSLYGGFAVSVMMSGKVDVRFPELPGAVRITSNDLGGLSGNGNGAFVGISARYSEFTLFLEARTMRMTLSGENFGDEVDVSLTSRQTVLGIAYGFM